jgi:hypothetical protein
MGRNGRRRVVERMAAALAATALGGTVHAQTPAECAARALDREVARDRLREAERAPALAPAPGGAAARAEQLDRDRTSLQPGVGRPEEQGRLPDAQRGTGADPNVAR